MREVSRLTFDDKEKPHWIAAEADGHRIVLNSGEYGDHRLFIVNFDPQTGALKLDEHFRDPGSERPGVSMEGRSWPHGIPWGCVPTWDCVFAPCGCGSERLDKGLGQPAPEVDVPRSKE